MTINDILDIFVIIFGICLVIKIGKIIWPYIVKKGIKEIEKNPKWITSKIEYYGFQDIDITIAESTFTPLPCFRVKKGGGYELLISEDTSTKDVDEIIQLALLGKIKVKYGLFFPNKPVYWLSILCYMLDGGDIIQQAASCEQLDENNK